jgi:transposase
MLFVCSDMWQPYLKVVAKKACQAVHALDRSHIMQRMGKAMRRCKPWFTISPQEKLLAMIATRSNRGRCEVRPPTTAYCRG